MQRGLHQDRVICFRILGYMYGLRGKRQSNNVNGSERYALSLCNLGTARGNYKSC